MSSGLYAILPMITSRRIMLRSGTKNSGYILSHLYMPALREVLGNALAK